MAKTTLLGVRSVRRGIGPSHQSAELPVERMRELTMDEVPSDPEAPVGFVNQAAVSDFFVLREVESSLMLRSSVRIDYEAMVVHIWLPACKTDPRATTCTRAWGCVCVDASVPIVACLFHACSRQAKLPAKLFGVPAKDEIDLLPFSPTVAGNTIDKERVVEMIEAAAAILGLQLVGLDGRRALGGHAFRVS